MTYTYQGYTVKRRRQETESRLAYLPAGKQERNTTMTETTLTRAVLTVPDISCDHCARTIMNALTPVAAIATVAVDIPSKTVRVSYDPTRIDVAQVATILAEEEYPVAAVDGGNPSPLAE